MAWDGVPWAVGGGAQHTPETARTAIHVATGGAEGIVAPTDLRVVPLAVPGGSVRVLPGAALIVSRETGGAQQTYTARNPTEDVVAIAPTGSSSGRSDLIVARIEDPFVAGSPYQDPVDPKVGPYVYTRVISNVPAGATTHASVGSGIVLARVDLPANTGTVQASHIVDLRKIAQPRRTRDIYNAQPTATSAVSSATFVDWTPAANRSIAIPSWATQGKIVVHIAGAAPAGAATSGQTRFMLGTIASDGPVFDMDASTRATLLAAQTFSIPANLRGTTQTLKLQAARHTGTGSVKTDTYSSVVWDVEFLEVASAS